MTQVLFLFDFSVIKPDPGLIFWTGLTFIIVYILLTRFAFKPIQEALKKREDDIQASLDEAKKAREEMANLKAENEELLNEARKERAKIIREANMVKENIIKEAKDRAKEEAKKIVSAAKEEIEHQKMAAIIDLKNQVGTMALDIAEKLIKKDLKEDPNQEKFANKLVDEINWG